MKSKWKNFIIEHLALAGVWIAYAIIFVLATLFSLTASIFIMRALMEAVHG